MATVTITYYGVDGTGRNLTEAKRDAGARIERMARHSFPRIFTHRGYTLVCYVTSCGASYSIAHVDTDGETVGSSSASDMHDATISGIKHLLTMVRKEGEFTFPEWAQRRLTHQQLDAIESDWRRNDRFQAAYREATAQGLADCEAHAYACRAA
jgi:hypothetical protein